MYNQKIYSKKSILSQLLFAVFLIAALAALILTPTFKASAVSASSLWTGGNFTATAGAAESTGAEGAPNAGKDTAGTTLTTTTPQKTTATYAKVLPIVYDRALLSGGTEAGALSIKFKITARNFSKLSFELVGYVKKDKKKNEKIKIEFDFADYSESNKHFVVNLSVDGGEVGETGVTAFDGITIDENTEFEISYDPNEGAGAFKVLVAATQKTLNKNTDSTTGVPQARDSLRFTNDTANLSVTLDGFAEEDAVNGSVLFSEINGQTLCLVGSNSEIVNGTDLAGIYNKPVINMDKGVTTAPTEMKAALDTSVNLPFLVTDVINSSFHYYIEVIEPNTNYTANSPSVANPPEEEEGKTIKNDTNVFTFEGLASGINPPSFSATDCNSGDYYIITVYAANTDLASLKAAVRSLGQPPAGDPPVDVDKSATVVTLQFWYKVVKDEETTPPEIDEAEGGYDIVMSPVEDGGLGGMHQDLPEQYQDFTFPQPEFKDNVDEKYQLKYTLAYKYETSTTWQISTSLSFNITQTGLFVFRYIVTDSSENGTEYLFSDYKEFKIYFTDVTPPKITMDSTEITLKKGAKLTVPTASATDNSSTGATVTVAKMYYKTGVNAGGEVDLGADGLVMNDLGSFEFELYYEGEDTNNNKASLRTDYLVKVEAADPTPTNAMLIVLIIIGGLSLAGIVALLFIKPIEEPRTGGGI